MKVKVGAAKFPTLSSIWGRTRGRKRYRVIDREWLLRLLAVSDMTEFRRWYRRTFDELCRTEEPYPRGNRTAKPH